MNTNVSINRTRLIGRLAAAAVTVAIPLAVMSIDSASAKTTHAPRPAGISININGEVSANGGHSGLNVSGSISADAGTAPGSNASDGPGNSNGACDPSPAPSPAPSQSPTDAPTAPSSPAPTDSPSTAPAGSTGGDHCGDSASHRANLRGAQVRVHARLHVKAGMKTAIKATVATAKGKVLATGRAVLLEGGKQISAAAVAAGKVTFTAARFAEGTHRLQVALVSDTGSLVTTKATLIVTAV